MHTKELPHNTDEQVREYLQAALAVVADLELDDDLRVPAFIKAVDLFASKQIIYEQAPALAALPPYPQQ